MQLPFPIDSEKVNGKNLPPKVWSKETQIRCLMAELEIAIANGDHQRAAIIAKELAIKRASCSLSGQFGGGSKDSSVNFNSPIV